jgi:hypothetical protein
MWMSSNTCYSRGRSTAEAIWERVLCDYVEVGSMGKRPSVVQYGVLLSSCHASSAPAPPTRRSRPALLSTHPNRLQSLAHSAPAPPPQPPLGSLATMSPLCLQLAHTVFGHPPWLPQRLPWPTAGRSPHTAL